MDGEFSSRVSGSTDPDGKKWQCSRNDHKYCPRDKDIKRGRHHSRKPMEGHTAHTGQAASWPTNTKVVPGCLLSSLGSSSNPVAVPPTMSLLHFSTRSKACSLLVSPMLLLTQLLTGELSQLSWLWWSGFNSAYAHTFDLLPFTFTFYESDYSISKITLKRFYSKTDLFFLPLMPCRVVVDIVLLLIILLKSSVLVLDRDGIVFELDFNWDRNMNGSNV